MLNVTRRSQVVLPPPFHRITAVWNKRTKGSVIVVCITNDMEIIVFKCRHGIRFIQEIHYPLTKDMIFIQCPNVTEKSVGFVCVGIMNNGRPSTERNRFSSLRNGFVKHDCFIFLSQGLYYCSTGELCIVLHKLVTRGDLMTDVITSFYDNALGFIHHCFEKMPLIIPMADISLLYLNQIAGPSLEHWNLKPSIHHESGTDRKSVV